MIEAPELETSIDINATPSQVWAVLSDLSNMAKWSPQVVKQFVKGSPVGLGTTSLNINRSGWKVWPTNSKIVRFDVDQELAFKIKENGTIWSFALTPNTTGGTTVVHKRETPEGISKISDTLTRRVLGGHEGFRKELEAGMATTLTKLKADAEA